MSCRIARAKVKIFDGKPNPEMALIASASCGETAWVPQERWIPDSLVLARLGARSALPEEDALPEPLYLRRPEAQLNQERGLLKDKGL